ncbi:MAG TPA: hypothetical protein VIB00_05570 [Pyrinomonadaceae bacterium]|jgi:hypothetical protein
MLRAFSVLLLVHVSLAVIQAQAASEVASLTGTVWAGTVKAPDSMGKVRDYPYTFQLLSGNKLRWHWEGGDFTNGTWRQTGNVVRLELNDGYSTWSGTFDGDAMSGSATNKLGHKWNWALTRREADAHANTWVEYSSTPGRFRAFMPSDPEVREQPVETPAGKLINHVFMSKAGESSVMVIAYSDYPQSTEDPQVVLDRVLNATISGIGATLVKSDAITHKGFPGRDYQATTSGLTYFARIYLVNRRLYQAAVVGPPNDLKPESVQKFLASFDISPSQ